MYTESSWDDLSKFFKGVHMQNPSPQTELVKFSFLIGRSLIHPLTGRFFALITETDIDDQDALINTEFAEIAI